MEANPFHVTADTQLSFAPLRGILRGEFFGGLLWDNRRFEQVAFDQASYALAVLLLDGPERYGALEEILTRGGFARSEIEVSVRCLLDVRILTTDVVEFHELRHFPMRDAELSYLQAPTVVEAELTYGCFRACKHCAYNSSPDFDTSTDISAAEWSVIIQKLADAGVFVLQMTGGDPFFRKNDIFDIIAMANDAGLSILLRSDTVSVPPSRYAALAGMQNLWHLGTSMDGATSAQHDWMRGPGAFRVMEDRIPKLVKAGVRVSCGTTLHKGNIGELEAMGELATAWGASWFDIGFLAPSGRGAELAEYVLEPSQIAEAIERYVAAAAAGSFVPLHSHYRRRSIGLVGPSVLTRDELDVVGAGLPYMTEWPFSRLRVEPTGTTYTAGKLKGTDFSGGYSLIHHDLSLVWDTSPNLVRLRNRGTGRRMHSLDVRILKSIGEEEKEVELAMILADGVN